jgi:hypothetical protein
MGGIAKVVEHAGIPQIRVTAIDYASFHLTEEQEIFRAQPKPGEKQDDTTGAGMWQDFVSLLSKGTLASRGDGVSLKDSLQIDPVELARLLNERKLDSGVAVQTYDRIISSYVRTAEERKQPTKEQSDTIANLNTLLKDLHPDIRKQFLSAAFRNVSENAARPGAEEVLGGLGDDMIIDMLRQASMEGREISPTLTGLLGKLASVRDKKGPASAGGGASGRGPSGGGSAVSSTGSGSSAEGKVGESQKIIPEQMGKLFDREQYEHYVEKEYDDILKKVSGRAEALATTAKDKFPLDESLKSLDDQHLDFQIGRAVLAFMEENIEEEDYREFARKLITIVPDMLASGHFALLLDTLQTLRWHLSDKKSDRMRTSAAEALKVFWEPDFLNKAIDAFNSWSGSKGEEATTFLLALGPILVPGLLDALARDHPPEGPKAMVDLLSAFGDSTVNEVKKRLRDPRPQYVQNALLFIRHAGIASLIPSVRPLLKHAEPAVKREAMATLLRFKDGDTVRRLRQEINSRDPETSSAALFLAGQFRIADAVEDILGRLKRTIIFETDYRVNEELIKALGEIGDPRAVPDLERMARANWSLYPRSQARMKLTLFESLGGYPRKSVAELLRIGARSSDEKIRTLCRTLAERSS